MRRLSCWHKLRERGLSATGAAEGLDLPRSTLYRWHKKLSEEVQSSAYQESSPSQDARPHVER